MNDRTLDSAGAGIRALDPRAAARARAGKLMCIFLLCSIVALTTGMKSCQSETLFRSNFDTTGLNQTPSPTQAVGTASFAGVPGSVLVVQAPPNASPPAKWLKIFRPNDPGQISIFRGQMKRQPGNGAYVFTTFLVIPDGNTGPASIQFETFHQPSNGGGFLHLDFMPDGRVRIDDDPSTMFGTFARNQPFLVQVVLTINDTSAKAHIALSGAGASGKTERTVRPPLVPQAQQFGAVRLFMGFPHLGSFHATNVEVTRRS